MNAGAAFGRLGSQAEDLGASFGHAREMAEDSRAARDGFWPRLPVPYISQAHSQRPDADSLCDYSGSMRPVFKGNVDARTGERVYHVPGGLFYSTTLISMDAGDSWLCTEEDALAAGWDRSAH